MACRKACPARRRRSTWLSRVGRPQGHNRSTCTGRQSGAGKGQRARTSVRARASEFRLQTSVSNTSCLPRAQAKRETSEGWTTRVASQDPHGELLRAKRGDVPKEGVSDRGKPSLSRGAGETISIQRAPRKPTCEGGGVTRGVTGRQRQSREWSESALGSDAQKAATTRREGKYPFSPPHGLPKRIQRVVKRRILRSHHTFGCGPKRVGSQERGYRVRNAVDGRSRSDASRRSCEIMSI